MNIAARLIGVGTFAYFLLMFCLLIIYTNISVRSLLGWYTVVLAVMGFFYEPYITADLYRIREMMVTFSAMELPAFLRTYVANSAVPVARMLYWSIGKTGILGLLPALACLVSYGCAFHMVSDTARRCGSKRTDVALAVLFIMSAGQYMSTVSNIRTMLALSMICMCLYRETVERKRNGWNLVLYLLAAGTHTIAVPVIAMRLVVPVFSRRMRAWKKVAFLLLLAGAGGAVLTMMPWLRAELMEKINDYIFGDRYSYFWEYLIGTIALAGQVWILWRCRNLELAREGAFGSISRMLSLCLVAAVVLCFEFSVFHRLVTYVAPFLASVLMLVYFGSDAAGLRGNQVKNQRTVLAVVSLCMLFLSCSRGSLCSFKFF